MQPDSSEPSKVVWETLFSSYATTNDMLPQMYNHEFTECQHLVNKDVVDMSQEDLKLIGILKNRIKFVGEHYQVLLQFKKDKVNLPKYHSQAGKRFACLGKKLSRNLQFKQDYVKFMNELFRKGYSKESTPAVQAGTYLIMWSTTQTNL